MKVISMWNTTLYTLVAILNVIDIRMTVYIIYIYIAARLLIIWAAFDWNQLSLFLQYQINSCGQQTKDYGSPWNDQFRALSLFVNFPIVDKWRT